MVDIFCARRRCLVVLQPKRKNGHEINVPLQGVSSLPDGRYGSGDRRKVCTRARADRCQQRTVEPAGWDASTSSTCTNDTRTDHACRNGKCTNGTRTTGTRTRDVRINGSRTNDSPVNDSRTNERRINDSRINESCRSNTRVNDSHTDGSHTKDNSRCNDNCTNGGHSGNSRIDDASNESPDAPRRDDSCVDDTRVNHSRINPDRWVGRCRFRWHLGVRRGSQSFR
ncbi:MAG: hypothetical protein ABR915_02285 [Thermoguttaceae bacterium]